MHKYDMLLLKWTKRRIEAERGMSSLEFLSDLTNHIIIQWNKTTKLPKGGNCKQSYICKYSIPTERSVYWTASVPLLSPSSNKVSTTDPKEPTAEKKRPQHMVFLRPNLLKRSCIIKMGGGRTCLTLGDALVKVVGKTWNVANSPKTNRNSMMRFKSKGPFSRKSP